MLAKVFKILKVIRNEGKQTQTKYAFRLYALVLSSLKRFQVKQKIKKYKTSKWKKMLHKNLKVKAFNLFRVGV